MKNFISFASKHKLFILVLIGVVMTVMSAVITNHILEKNNAEISVLNKEIISIQNRIDNRWQSVQESERKLDLVIFTLSQKGNMSVEDEFMIRKYFLDWFSKNDDSDSISTSAGIKDYITFITNYKRVVIDEINDLYLTKTELQEEKDKISERNSSLKNLALLFQILGVILVLSKSF